MRLEETVRENKNLKYKIVRQDERNAVLQASLTESRAKVEELEEENTLLLADPIIEDLETELTESRARVEELEHNETMLEVSTLKCKTEWAYQEKKILKLTQELSALKDSASDIKIEQILKKMIGSRICDKAKAISSSILKEQ